MTATPFSRADAERRLGPAAVAAVRALVDAAPPLRGETRMQLQAVFASAPKPVPVPREQLAA
ncbi:hypothetical protein [Streptomyces sp. W1SF4]|uniref:hypothetical protein n=1 Tax=Streptomyces sp. W1SF4 TaxID=2305220 RepID=UPI000F704DB5|nr:hypothetical protein [Streptomyces sp. W1SF4]AZM91477.1 hypothetical protein D1J60_25830 [Streptomyces sp. W1SF4]